MIQLSYLEMGLLWAATGLSVLQICLSTSGPHPNILTRWLDLFGLVLIATFWPLSIIGLLVGWNKEIRETLNKSIYFKAKKDD